MHTVYDLTWNETSFPAKLQLFFKLRQEQKPNIRSGDRRERAKGYSALSSTYYSIVGTAIGQLGGALKSWWLAPVYLAVWCLTWLPLATWCRWRMLTFSNRVVRLIGYDAMSAEECDIRQNILRRCGRWAEAAKCIHAALSKNPEQAHTRGLLRVGLAAFHLHFSDPLGAVDEIWLAVAEARKAEDQDPRQAARIFRHCADVLDVIDLNVCGRVSRGNIYRRRAEELALAVGAKDQLLKL